MAQLSLAWGAAATAKPRRPAIAVGWQDEMNDVGGWQPFSGGNDPDVFAARFGAMTLRLPDAPEGFPHAWKWGAVTRRASVDLGRYPVLAAYVSRVDDGSYAHLDVEERDYAGRPVRSLRTPTLQGRGLNVVDVGQTWGSRRAAFTCASSWVVRFRGRPASTPSCALSGARTCRNCGPV
jgi:hypothetical protein